METEVGLEIKNQLLKNNIFIDINFYIYLQYLTFAIRKLINH